MDLAKTQSLYSRYALCVASNANTIGYNDALQCLSWLRYIKHNAMGTNKLDTIETSNYTVPLQPITCEDDKIPTVLNTYTRRTIDLHLKGLANNVTLCENIELSIVQEKSFVGALEQAMSVSKQKMQYTLKQSLFTSLRDALFKSMHVTDKNGNKKTASYTDDGVQVYDITSKEELVKLIDSLRKNAIDPYSGLPTGKLILFLPNAVISVLVDNLKESNCCDRLTPMMSNECGVDDGVYRYITGFGGEVVIDTRMPDGLFKKVLDQAGTGKTTGYFGFFAERMLLSYYSGNLFGDPGHCCDITVGKLGVVQIAPGNISFQDKLLSYRLFLKPNFMIHPARLEVLGMFGIDRVTPNAGFIIRIADSVLNKTNTGLIAPTKITGDILADTPNIVMFDEPVQDEKIEDVTLGIKPSRSKKTPESDGGK